MTEEKICHGCREEIDTDSYECVRFDIMVKSPKDQDEHRIYKEEFPQMLEVYRSKKMHINLHRKCLKEYIWMVLKYCEWSRHFSDLEIRVILNNTRLKYQVAPYKENDWIFRLILEAGDRYQWNTGLAVMFEEFISRRNMSFVTFVDDDKCSPPILTLNDDPMICDILSEPKNAEILKKTIDEYTKAFQRNEDIGVPEDIVLRSQVEFAIETSVRINKHNNSTISDRQSQDVKE